MPKLKGKVAVSAAHYIRPPPGLGEKGKSVQRAGRRIFRPSTEVRQEFSRPASPKPARESAFASRFTRHRCVFTAISLMLRDLFVQQAQDGLRFPDRPARSGTRTDMLTGGHETPWHNIRDSIQRP
jgi:hypothetical protein